MNIQRGGFILAALLLALFWFGCQDAGNQNRRRRSRGVTDATAEHVPPQMGFGRFIGGDELAWLSRGTNIFLAPRETQPLPPLKLLPPPFPRLPHPGLPVSLSLGGAARKNLRHSVEPDSSIVLLSEGSSRVVLNSDETNPLEADASDLEEVDTSAVGMSLADKLRMKAEDRLKAEQEEEEAQRQRAERLKRLDRIFWTSGTSDYGEVKTLNESGDRYKLKLEIDRIRNDPAINEEERRKQLDKIRLAFYEDRGPNRRPSRTLIQCGTVLRVEFAEAFPLNRFMVERHSADPGNEEHQLRLTDDIFAAGKHEAVAEHLQALHDRELGTVESHVRLAESYRRLLRYDDELGALDKGLQKAPNSPDLHARLGDVLLRLRSEGRAEASYRKALSYDPVHPVAHRGLGELLLSTRHATEALKHLRQAQSGAGLPTAEERLDALVSLGVAYLAAGDLDAASQTLDSALQRDAEHARALAARAVAAMASTGPEAARPFVMRGREAAPLNGQLAYLDGVVALMTGSYDTAQESLLVSMNLDPLLTSKVRTTLSYLREKAGQDEAANAEADLALLADPTDLDAHQQKARCLLNVGDLAGAREAYLQVLRSQPDRVDLLVALGDVSFHSGEEADAARFYERAHAIDANFPDLDGRRLVAAIKLRNKGSMQSIIGDLDASSSRNPFVQAILGFYYYDIAAKSEESIQRFRPLTDGADIPAPLSEYAKTTSAMILDHESKEKWTDEFNYRGTQVLGRWQKEVGTGVNILPQEGHVKFIGSQKKVSFEPTVLYQKREGRKLQSFNTTLDLKPQVGVYAGVGLIAFQRSTRSANPYPGMQTRGAEEKPYYGGQIALSPEGHWQFRYLDKGTMSDWVDIPGATHEGGLVAIGLEVLDRKAGMFRLTIDGRSVVTLKMEEIASRGRSVELQLFCQAQIDQAVEMSVDEVSIVTRKD